MPLLDLEAATLEFSQLSVTELAVRKTERLVSGLCKIEYQAPGIWDMVNIYYGYHLEHRQTGPVAKSLHFRIKYTAELTLNSLYLLNYCKCVDSFL